MPSLRSSRGKCSKDKSRRKEKKKKKVKQGGVETGRGRDKIDFGGGDEDQCIPGKQAVAYLNCILLNAFFFLYLFVIFFSHLIFLLSLMNSCSRKKKRKKKMAGKCRSEDLTGPR